MCKESNLKPEWKQRIIASKGSEDTVRTLLYDRMKFRQEDQDWEALGCVARGICLVVRFDQQLNCLPLKDSTAGFFATPLHPNTSLRPPAPNHSVLCSLISKRREVGASSGLTVIRFGLGWESAFIKYEDSVAEALGALEMEEVEALKGATKFLDAAL
jgi:hypothetical protein